MQVVFVADSSLRPCFVASQFSSQRFSDIRCSRATV